MSDPSGAAVRRVLANFVAPGRAEQLAATAADLPGAVSLLRTEYGVEDRDLVFALDDAGVSGSRAAALLGSDVRTVNEWLDREAAPVADGAGAARGIDVAARVLRFGWIALAVALAVVLLQSRGASDGACEEPLCVDAVEVRRTDGEVLELEQEAVVAPEDVARVDFVLRTDGTGWTGAVRWSVDGAPLLEAPVAVERDGTIPVLAPVARLPEGVHVVELLDAPAGATVAFSVER